MERGPAPRPALASVLRPLRTPRPSARGSNREDSMRTPTHAGFAIALALTLALGAAARGQDDPAAPPADPDEATGQGFPWLCFATTVGALGGLYVFVRRRERAAEAEPTAA